jgi:hypothetical protein
LSQAIVDKQAMKPIMNLEDVEPAVRRRPARELTAGRGGRFCRAAPARNLNQYIEAQVHGELVLRRDVEALVVDPAFCDTAMLVR